MKRKFLAFLVPLAAASLSLLFVVSSSLGQGQVYQPGDISAVNAGSGLVGGAQRGAANLAIDQAYTQRRGTLGSGCSGQAISTVGSDGTPSCIAAGPSGGSADFLGVWSGSNAITYRSLKDDGAGTVTQAYSGGPTYSFDDPSTSAAPKTIGRALWRAKDASGALQTQALITVEQSDKTNSSNDARFFIDLISGGTLTNGFRIQSSNSVDPLAKDGELWDTDLGRNNCVPSATVHCGEVWIHADDVDIGGTVTWGKIDGSGTSVGYGAGALGIANGAIPAADWSFGKNLTVNGKTYLVGAAGVDINGPLYLYVSPLMAGGAQIGDASGDQLIVVAGSYFQNFLELRSTGGSTNAVFRANGHEATVPLTSPVMSSCGGTVSPASGSTDKAGKFTSGSGTTCTLTFNATYTSAPSCTFAPEGSATLPTCTISATAITCSVVSATTTYNYRCTGLGSSST